MRAEINLGGNSTGSLIVGGVDLSNLTVGLSLRVTPGEPTELAIEMLPRAVTAEVDVRVVLPEALRDLLIQLGWQPPAADQAAQALNEKG